MEMVEWADLDFVQCLEEMIPIEAGSYQQRP
jgi:hypothetical protein